MMRMAARVAYWVVGLRISIVCGKGGVGVVVGVVVNGEEDVVDWS